MAVDTIIFLRKAKENANEPRHPFHKRYELCTINEGQYKMITEKSCGAVVFTKVNGQIKYVIIQSKAGFYGFPKGHMEENETEKETAFRDVREETGLMVDIVEPFRMEDIYPISCSGTQRMKHVVYFLAEYSNQIPVAQTTELSSVCLLNFEEALSILQFNSTKKILTQAQEFLFQCT